MGKRRFTVAHMEEYIRINNNPKIACVSHIHNWKSTFTFPCILNSHKFTEQQKGGHGKT